MAEHADHVTKFNQSRSAAKGFSGIFEFPA
jgi:hypothetical protein